jgi:hypothetical protein
VRLAGVAQIGSRVDVREQTGDVERFLHHVHFALGKSERGLYWYRQKCVSGSVSRAVHLRISRMQSGPLSARVSISSSCLCLNVTCNSSQEVLPFSLPLPDGHNL